jgi:hypothetical protein
MDNTVQYIGLNRCDGAPPGPGIRRPTLVPLFANDLVTHTGVVQTASDRFHRFLAEFLLVITEYFVNERLAWQEDLQALISRPEDGILRRKISSSGEWSLLLRKLDLVKDSFTRMLHADRASAVARFEVSSTLNPQFGPSGEELPLEREIIRAEFPSAFLASTFGLVWDSIQENGMEMVALWTLQRVTVSYIPVQWIRDDRESDETYAVTVALQGRCDQCDVCRDFAMLPYSSCRFCGDAPSWHHGSCCPSHRDFSRAYA